MIMNNAATLISQIQLILATFVGGVGQKVAEYGTLLGGRINPELYVSPWEYGSPSLQEDGSYKINVWHERAHSTIRIHITFNSTTTFLVKATCVLLNEGDTLIVAKTVGVDTSASSVALEIGAAFERKLTGRIEYSRDEWS